MCVVGNNFNSIEPTTHKILCVCFIFLRQASGYANTKEFPLFFRPAFGIL